MSVPSLPPRQPTLLGALRASTFTDSTWEKTIYNAFGSLRDIDTAKWLKPWMKRARILYNQNVPASNISPWAIARAIDVLLPHRYPTPERLAHLDEEQRATYHVIKDLWQILDMALACGADINKNVSNDYGQYPIQKAAAAGNDDLVELFVRHGADLEVRCHNGYTPLGCALSGWGKRVGPIQEREKTARKLIELGADLNNTRVQSTYHDKQFEKKFKQSEPATKASSEFPDLHLELVKKGVALTWEISQYCAEDMNNIPGDNHISTQMHVLFDEDNLIWDWKNESRLMAWLGEIEKRSGPLVELRSPRGWTPAMEAITFLHMLDMEDYKLDEDQFIERIEKLRRVGVICLTDMTKGGSTIWHAMFSNIKSKSFAKARLILEHYPETEQLLEHPNANGVKPRHILQYLLRRDSSGILVTDAGEVPCKLSHYDQSWNEIIQSLLAMTNHKALSAVSEKIIQQENIQLQERPKPKM